MTFRKKLVNIRCVFWFSLQLLSEIFLILRIIERDIINVHRYACQILMKLEFSGQILEKYSNIKFHENPSNGSRVVPWVLETWEGGACGWAFDFPHKTLWFYFSPTYLKASSLDPSSLYDIISLCAEGKSNHSVSVSPHFDIWLSWLIVT
jgi:hypothetical protein